MTDDLVKRLRSPEVFLMTSAMISPVAYEAADRIEALEAALQPFADWGVIMLPSDEYDKSIWVTCPDTTPVNNVTDLGFTFGHFRAAARAALAGEKKDDQ
jgi:hypothetical protein